MTEVRTSLLIIAVRILLVTLRLRLRAKRPRGREERFGNSVGTERSRN